MTADRTPTEHNTDFQVADGPAAPGTEPGDPFARPSATEHVIDGTCWCQPTVNYEDPVTGGRVIVHKATIS